jgi:hypothetical protein
MPEKAVKTKVQAPEQPSRPAPELKRLETLIGKWKNDIEFKNDPDNSGTGSVTYEWMEGRFFIVERFEQRFAKEGTHQGISIIGYDGESRACLSHFFDNHGNIREYRLTIEDRQFKVSGPWERFTGEISKDESRITGTWELSKDGSNWQYLCDSTLTRLSSG